MCTCGDPHRSRPEVTLQTSSRRPWGGESVCVCVCVCVVRVRVHVCVRTCVLCACV